MIRAQCQSFSAAAKGFDSSSEKLSGAVTGQGKASTSKTPNHRAYFVDSIGSVATASAFNAAEDLEAKSSCSIGGTSSTGGVPDLAYSFGSGGWSVWRWQLSRISRGS